MSCSCVVFTIASSAYIFNFFSSFKNYIKSKKKRKKLCIFFSSYPYHVIGSILSSKNYCMRLSHTYIFHTINYSRSSYVWLNLLDLKVFLNVYIYSTFLFVRAHTRTYKVYKISCQFLFSYPDIYLLMISFTHSHTHMHTHKDRIMIL